MTAGPVPASKAPGRRLVIDIHTLVRNLILDGDLAPGTTVTQAELARRLGVSRTPLREAFRMLQEEGLIVTAPNQRARISDIDVAHVDQVYAARILLESLQVALMFSELTPERLEEMSVLLDQMGKFAEAGEWDRWQVAHQRFHAVHSAAAVGQVQQMLAGLAEHSQRYVRKNQARRAESLTMANREHAALLDALRGGDQAVAIDTIVRHLARTALTVMADSAPEYEPVAVRTALRLAMRSSGG
ncbi:GntR family transcriptional regulator [Nonomuraea sp. NPDC047897]|jgi:DNA-binding GntR family transcriptional regulator|uniref:GntR family transcriptional regulator n=1 Tax=Nonomuraea sp. NPDC047897 TaxID=3364346 RepID=UPI003716CCAB